MWVQKGGFKGEKHLKSPWRRTKEGLNPSGNNIKAPEALKPLKATFIRIKLKALLKAPESEGNEGLFTFKRFLSLFLTSFFVPSFVPSFLRAWLPSLLFLNLCFLLRSDRTFLDKNIFVSCLTSFFIISRVIYLYIFSYIYINTYINNFSYVVY